MKMLNKKKTHLIDEYIVQFIQESDKQSFGSKDKIFFFKELWYMLKGGVSLVEATDMLAKHSENFSIRTIAKEISGYLHSGKTLSYSINRFPDYFNEWDYYIIKSWEKTWNLDHVLSELAEEYWYLNEIKQKYVGAMIYPVILIVISVVAIIALFGFVLPWIFEIANSFPNLEIPLVTRILQDISGFITTQRKGILGFVIFWALFLWAFFSTSSGQKTMYKMLLWIPYIGKMTKYYYLIKFARYMKLMNQSGLNYVETFTLLRDILWIPVYQKIIEHILVWLQKWHSIYESIKDYPNIIPSNVALLIKVWEETANVDKALDNTLKIYQAELNHMVDWLSKVIEPVMLVFIWWVVVVVAMWVFGIILQVMQNVWI